MCALALGLVAYSAPARADPPPATNAADSEAAARNAAQRRDPAYYRGRREPVSAARTLLWIPRVLLFPLYAVAQYGVRVPTHAAIEWAEGSHAIAYMARVFHPVPDFSWMPTAVIDLGVLPSVGVHLRWNHAGFQANQLRGTFATGGADFWLADVEDRVRLDDFTFGVRGYFVTRPDRVFYGLGPLSNVDSKTYYRLTRIEAHVFGTWEPSTHVFLALDAAYRDEHTGEGWEPFIGTRFQLPDAAPGLGHVRLFLADARAAIDSRHDRLGVSGVRLDAHARYAIDPTDRQQQFVQAEVNLQGALEVIRPFRTLSLSLYAADTQPLGSQAVPFTDQITLGRDLHQGYLYGRYIGDSAVLGTLAWRWPVWDALDMFVQSSVGNVFGVHFQGFDPRVFSASFGVGLRTRIDNAASFQLIVAAGTTRFDQPFGIEGVRVFANVSPGL